MNTYILRPPLLRMISFFIIGIFLWSFTPLYVHASPGDTIVISEIMYDLPGSDTAGSASREWIEIKNIGTSSVDITGWKLFDGSNHVLNAPSSENGGQGTLVIEPGGFAVIAANALQFVVDNPSFGGTLIDSVLSLNNEGDTVKICSATCSVSTVVSEVAYTSALGASGDGNSLQLYQSGWIANTPTPGSDTVSVVSSGGSGSSGEGSSGGGNTTTTSSGTSSSVSVKPVFLDSHKEPSWNDELAISMPSLFAHVPFIVTPTITNPKMQTYASGRFVYTLGDGRILEKKNSEPLSVEYEDAGTYVFYFEFYEHDTDTKPTIVDRMLLAVEDAPIILNIDFQNENKITLSNLHSKDINMSQWRITDGPSYFVFPKNTFLPGKKEVTINKNMYHTYSKTLSLVTPTGHTVATFPSSVKKITQIPYTQLATASEQDVPPVPPFFSEVQSLPEQNDTATKPVEMSDASLTPHSQSALSFVGFSSFGHIDSWTVLFCFFILLVGVLFLILLRRTQKDTSLSTTESTSHGEAQKYTVEEI